MKVLIIGGKGMLGHKLVQRLGPGFDVWATLHRRYEDVETFGIFQSDRIFENIDVTEPAQLRPVVEQLKPHVVINCSGIIKQVAASKNVIQTLLVNSIFPHRLAEMSAEYGFRLITISTDCVFDGKKGRYTETDESTATDLYGRSKNLGEVIQKNCLTIRTSIIGRELDAGHSLVEWFLSNRGKSIRGFTEAIYTGFPTIVFADIISGLIVKYPDLEGLYHISSEPISKFQLLVLLNKFYDTGIQISPDHDFQMDRSLDSSRFRALTGFRADSWEEMVSRLKDDPTPYDKWKQRIN